MPVAYSTNINLSTLQAAIHTFSFLSRFLLLYPNCSVLICRLLKLQLLLQTPQQTTRMQVAEEPENITKYGVVFLGICFLHGVCLSAVRAHSVNVKQLSWRDYLQKWPWPCVTWLINMLISLFCIFSASQKWKTYKIGLPLCKSVHGNQMKSKSTWVISPSK